MDGRDPLHPGRQRPEQPAYAGTGELGGPQHQCQLQVDVAGVEVGPEREPEQRDRDRGGQRALAVGPVDGPQQQQDRADAPGEPGHVPGQGRPGREQREHPRGVDVRQERAGRMVRIAAVEPDPDARPVGARVRAAGLAPGDHPGQDQRERQAQQEHRRDPVRVAGARRLATERPPEDAGSTPRAAVDRIGQLDRDPSEAARGARDGAQVRFGEFVHRGAFSHARDPFQPGRGPAHGHAPLPAPSVGYPLPSRKELDVCWPKEP